MGRRLRVSTIVPVSGGDGFKIYGPGDDVPDEHAAMIGDHAWEDGDAAEDGGEGGGAPAIPPRGGPGSGQDAWLAYAQSLGVDVADDTSRDDIVAAVEAAGHPVSAE